MAADEERVKAEAAEPLPPGSTWVKVGSQEMGGPELEPLLAHTTLINVDWLVDFADGKVMPEREGVVPAWQQLPSEAIVSLTQLRQTTYAYGLPVAVLSYGWAAKHHPDPTGEQLRRMLPALRSMKNFKRKGGVPTWGLVWDFMSLPQRGYTTKYDADHEDRTDYQLKRFGKGLKHINVWYGHEHVTTLVCDWPMPAGAQNPHPIDVRGWCVFERHLSSIVKFSECYLQLSRLPADAESMRWMDVVDACQGARRPPLAADAFERLMRDSTASGAFKFTNGKDATNVCIPQYAEAFTRLLGTSKLLGYYKRGGGAAEGEQLAAALTCAQRMGTAVAADTLAIRGNKLGTAGVRAIGKVIEAGALPRLKELGIHDNGADDETREWIETVARGAGCSRVAA